MSQPNNPHHPDDDYGQTNAQGGGQYGDYASAGDTSHGTGGYDFAVEHNQSVENQQPANAYYAGGYEAPQYSGFEAQQETKNPVAPWALGIGILSLVGSLIALGSFLGLIGFVVAIVSLVKGRKRQPENRRTVMSVVGLVTSILAVLVGFIIMLVGFKLIEETGVIDCVEQHGNNEDAIEQCVNANFENFDN